MKTFLSILVIILILALGLTYNELEKKKDELNEFYSSVEYLRKHLFCFEDMFFGLTIDEGLQVKNATKVLVNDTVALIPNLIVNSFITFDSSNAKPYVVFFEYLDNEFIAFDTVSYKDINNCKYVLNQTGKKYVFATIYIEQYGYKISFESLITLYGVRNLCDSVPMDEKEFADMNELYLKFQKYSNSIFDK